VGLFSKVGSPVRPIVATKDREIADPELLRFLIESAIPGDQFKLVRDRIKSLAWRLPSTCEKLIDQFETWLKDEVGRPNATRREIAICRAAVGELQRNSWQIEQTRAAYETADKPNPHAVYWPNPTLPAPHSRPLHGLIPFAKRVGRITRATPIGSAGSCFAMEIMGYLKERNYNYVVTEPNRYSCANWGALFNSIAFRQMVEWSFGLRDRPLLVWEEPAEGGRVEYHDPFREGVSYKTLDEIGPEIAKHRTAARKALESVEWFILTVGLNEVWRLGFSDIILARYPRNLAPYIVRGEVLSVEQNVEALQGGLDVLRSFNPRIQLIVTVSPIPLYASFQGHEKHVVVATSEAKATLRVAVERFAASNRGCVTYFPAMETVLWCTKNPWDPDLRHVSREAVGNVMRLFEEVYLSAGAPS
jgi:hypothetical protein